MRRGFTLIELLVVIAIIAVLMGILMPALRAAKDHATRIHCVGNVKTLALAWTLYAQDNDNRLVNAMIETEEHAIQYNRTLPWVLAPAGGQNADVEAKIQAIKDGALWTYVGKTEKVYRCPADQRLKHPIAVSYCSFSIPDGANGEGWPSNECVLAKNLSDIKRPSEKYIFLEDIDTRGYNVGSWAFQFSNREWIDPLAVWHKGRSTMGYADSHAETHAWHDKSFLDWADGAVEQALTGPVGTYRRLTVLDTEVTDWNYMVNGFPCKSHP